MKNFILGLLMTILGMVICVGASHASKIENAVKSELVVSSASHDAASAATVTGFENLSFLRAGNSYKASVVNLSFSKSISAYFKDPGRTNRSSEHNYATLPKSITLRFPNSEFNPISTPKTLEGHPSIQCRLVENHWQC